MKDLVYMDTRNNSLCALADYDIVVCVCVLLQPMVIVNASITE